jgi:hypothetical protein
MSFDSINRREFMALTAGVTSALGLGQSSPPQVGPGSWDPQRPLIRTGRALMVQPILMYQVAERRPAASWKSWGGVQSDEAADKEAASIAQELSALSAKADFPVRVLPIVKVDSPAQVAKVHEGDYDAVIVYAASGSGDLLRACFAAKKDKDTVIFVRQRSGPAYYWYEGLSRKYLLTDKADSRQNSRLDHGGLHVDDVVVDDYDEVLWRLRALYGLKNFLGTRIVALGGPWGKYSPEAPQVARDKFGLEIIDVSYDDVAARLQAARLQAARQDGDLTARTQQWTEAYLSLPHTTLETDKEFVVNTFLLYTIFKDLMREHNAPAFTIRSCMGTIMPMARTTACLVLSLINDEGLMAFCESDFVIIPAGILLHYVSGRPVFLHNSTFPHGRIVTCAHCTAPRRLDGTRYEPARILTHYESDYGAAPKVEVPIGQQVTFIDPEYSSGRWLGFTGIVRSNPFYEICRSQQDVEIQGDWRKLLGEVRDSHWMMAYGNHLQPLSYAARKLGIQWVDLTQA